MVLEFMDNIKNDHYYLEKIKKDIAFIVTHMKDVDLQELNENEVLLDSMLFRMIQISENAKKLSAEYKSEKSGLPWDEMSGLRNRIVHDYGNVDLEIVYETLKYDIPELMEQLKEN
ncbi:HepT-like ribonuclease domain-containing protein [Butyrivibrio sp. WCE2006]|uniref:HepT-like ribonuclease domain-containing protein n=1 Tax=Butyrivibrio sp. WCE2006 TaxID=1410611 RepID=UPI003FA426F7